MRPFRGRRSSYRLLFLFFVVAVVYMMFQFFSINMLSLHNKMMQKHEKRKYFPESNINPKAKRQQNVDNGGNKRDGGRKTDIKNDRGVKQKEEIMHNIPLKDSDIINNVREQLEGGKAVMVEDGLKRLTEQTVHQKRDFHLFTRTLHGVHQDLVSHYEDTAGKFHCLHTKEIIDMDQVNDDYCDCADGTDEPGTSACQNNRFYCAMQIDGAKTLKSVSASFVNDGICDCCDGSDEWQGQQLPDNIRIDNPSRKYPVNHAPCKNTCHEAQQEAMKLQKIKKMGLRLKYEYIEEAKKHYVSDKKYGSQGEYFNLSHSCFEITHSGFEYNVCPFVKVIQTENKRNQKNLGGSDVTWIKENEVKMGEGDSMQCPGGIKRSTLIKFTCGLEDKLLSVTESSICEYTFTMTSPAAC